jgi:hypothetical protein
MGGAVVEGKIFAIGGASGYHDLIASVEEYNPYLNSWTTKTSLPTLRWGLAADTVNGKVYAIGGAGQANERLKAVEIYNPAADTGAVTNIVSPERSSSFLWIFPNPFSSSTTFQYTLAVTSHVRLCVYDIPGHEVNLLVNEKEPAGCREIKWDGRDKCGLQVADGIYFCTLIINNKLVETKKLMLQN